MYSIIQTLKAGQILAPFTPTEGSNASEEEICYCKAKVTQANPPFGSFYVWAVGIYHSLTWFGCFYPQGPVGLLWNEGDEYVFTLCKRSPQIILEFAVSPPPNPAQWVPVSVTVRLECNNGEFTSTEGIRYVTFRAGAGETVEDRRAFFWPDRNCNFAETE